MLVIGDVVKMKGVDGPKMTVESISKSRFIDVVWFDLNDQLHRTGYKESELEKV
jgi:uncharacterized protein YodC (DUF2158 family)